MIEKMEDAVWSSHGPLRSIKTEEEEEENHDRLRKYIQNG